MKFTMKKITLTTSATLLALALSACSNSSTDTTSTDTASTDATNTEAVTEQTAQTDLAANDSTTDTAQPTFITINDAIAAATNNTAGDIISADFDTHDNDEAAEYEVEVIANDLIHEIKVNATTADIISVTQKSLDAEDQAEHQALQQAQVTLEQAMQIAADSLSNAAVTEASFDVEQGMSIYEINLFADNQQHEVKVDANTGSILSSKLD